MSDVIGRGVIELVADARAFKATMDDAKKSIKDLGASQGSANASASKSIDAYIQRLQVQAQTIGMSTREADLFKLGVRGASDAQMIAADSAMRLATAHKETERTLGQLKTGMIGFGIAAVAGIGAAVVAFDHFAHYAGEFQDMSEKMGDTGEAIASLAVAAAVGGMNMEQLVGASAKLTKNLTGVDDESKAAGAAVTALGLNLDNFKKLSPTDQLEAIGKALAGFKDGSEKTAVAMALFGKAGADALPALKELATGVGRVNILTSEQITLADEYADKQKALRTEISLYAGAIASEMLPAFSDLTKGTLELIKNLAGVKDGVKGLDSAPIRTFAEDAVKWLAKTVDAIDRTARMIEILAKSLAMLDAVKAALNRGEIFGAISAGQAFREDVDAISNRPYLGGLVAAAAQNRKEAPELTGPPKPAKLDNRPALKFDGAITGAAAAAAAARAEAAAKLVADLDQIQKAGEATVASFANTDRIMGAMRAAGLLEDKAYFEAKQTFINDNEAVEVEALQKKIARLQAEKLTGKDAIDNARKVADAEAALAKVRETAATNSVINSVQENAAIRSRAQAYRDAENAAQEYLDTITRTQARELAGIGAGTQQRDYTAGATQIADKYSAELKTLNQGRIRAEFAGTFGPEAQKKYDDELDRIYRFKKLALADFDDYYAARLTAESDWQNGASEAMHNYYSTARNVAKQTEELFTNAFKGMEDALVAFVKTGKLDFASLVDSIITGIIRIQVQNSIAQAASAVSGAGGLMGLFGGLFGGSGTQAPAPVEYPLESLTAGAVAYADGTDYVPSTGLYKLHQGEAVLTAAENSAGRGASPVTVNIINNADPVAVQQSAPRFDGSQTVIDIVLQRIRTDSVARDNMRAALSAPV